MQVMIYRASHRKESKKLTLKEEYFFKLSFLGNQKGLKTKMTKMFECGFKNFEFNKGLLIKFNYNIG
jgi:hypothetical protein